MINKDTICAIATSNNTIAGISIIRVSGELALEIGKQVVTKFKNLDIIEPRYMYYSSIELENGKDKCLAVYFKAPFSFTGEDIVELHLHGGIKLTELVLHKCIELGARLAGKGEFSKRAFLNGKQTLESLEGVIDIINAESEAQLSAGFNLTNGNLRQKLFAMQDNLTDILAEIEVSLDYPEEDIEYKTENEIKQKLDKVSNCIKDLISTSKNGRLIKNGINIAIIGKPNVGKSSLLNALLEYERAIVTEIAGTTRDSIEDSFIYKGVKFNISDTAGIRNSSDKVEAIGIERAIKIINSANIILLVIDLSRELDDEDKKIFELVNTANIPCILVKNKLDAKLESEFSFENVRHIKEIEISAKTNNNVSELKNCLYELTLGKEFDANSVMLSNERHIEALQKAGKSLQNAIEAIGTISLDCVALDIKDAWNYLGEITGKTITEEVLDTIFTKFCLGK